MASIEKLSYFALDFDDDVAVTIVQYVLMCLFLPHLRIRT
jgi:hypothetical protein